jgi:hypothetical protein
MNRDAGLKEWMGWMALPLSTILKEHKELIYGPVDDLMDEVIRQLAPRIVKAVIEQEVDEDVTEYLEGAQEGRFEALQDLFADPEPNTSEDYKSGYGWGFANAQSWNGRDLPTGVRRQVVQDQLKEFKGEVTEQVVIALMEKAWHALSPAHTIKAMIKAVKKHGWKLGIGFVLFEIVEHALLPTLMIKLTGNPNWAILGTLPIGEIIYAIALRVLGRTPKELDKLDEDGHLDWYEAEYGPVRVAALRRASCERVATRYLVLRSA